MTKRKRVKYISIPRMEHWHAFLTTASDQRNSNCEIPVTDGQER